MKLPYNPSDKNSVLEFAKKLKDKTLRQVCQTSILDHTYSGKGNFGQVLEKYYFGYNPNSNAEADFAKIGMELKSSTLKQLKNKEYRSKERLVLNIINYFK
jgi:DNA mismatch repair protein MutH